MLKRNVHSCQKNEIFFIPKNLKLQYMYQQPKIQQTLHSLHVLYMYIPSIRELQTDDIEYLGAGMTLVVLYPLPHLHREVILT